MIATILSHLKPTFITIGSQGVLPCIEYGSTLYVSPGENGISSESLHTTPINTRMIYIHLRIDLVNISLLLKSLSSYVLCIINYIYIYIYIYIYTYYIIIIVLVLSNILILNT